MTIPSIMPQLLYLVETRAYVIKQSHDSKGLMIKVHY